TSRLTDNVHSTLSARYAPARCFECRAFPAAAAKSESQELRLLPPIPQTLFLLQSRSAPKSVSVYGPSILLVMGAPQSFAACRCLPDRARRRPSKQVLGRRGMERGMRNRLK